MEVAKTLWVTCPLVTLIQQDQIYLFFSGLHKQCNMPNHGISSVAFNFCILLITEDLWGILITISTSQKI